MTITSFLYGRTGQVIKQILIGQCDFFKILDIAFLPTENNETLYGGIPYTAHVFMLFLGQVRLS